LEEKTEQVIEVQNEAKLDDKKKWCVYCHTNKYNGKKYFGITSRNPEKRWGKNGNEYRESLHPVFGKAIQKYGWDGFEHEILFDNLSKQEACDKEVELIAKYKTNCTKYKNPSYGYNMSDGGEYGSAGYVWSDEARKRLSEILTGRVVSPETRQILSEQRTGVPLSLSHRKNLSKSHMGNPSPRKGIKLDDDTKSKISSSKLANYDGNPIYCIELSQIFYSASDASRKNNIDASAIIKCCRGKQSYAGRNSLQKQYFHWLYAKDHIEKDGTIIQGAITLGYITEEQVNDYLNNLRQKGIDI
jgi:group I intron endonuclease